uniref:Uncharacterized protein n=2 Tax=Aegilops tauschii TaxID=37682 RepID=A0A453KWM9_AEGTS
MGDLCFDVSGIAKEKKDPTSIKGNRELLDCLAKGNMRMTAIIPMNHRGMTMMTS